MDGLHSVELNLALVNKKIEDAFETSTVPDKKKPYLVAASKIQPKEYIIKAYECGQRHFGENYIQELQQKAIEPEIIAKCPDIQWHLIGHLQSNKINKLLSSPNLKVIESIDSIKLAEALNSAIGRNENIIGKINVFVQVNTSNEEAKSGINPEQTSELVRFIIDKCDRLNFVGLMTIGAYGYDVSLGPNPDYVRLLQVRDSVCHQLNLPKLQVDLSMGMSCDYEHAIKLGSTVVRVGTAIFGERKYNKN